MRFKRMAWLLVATISGCTEKKAEYSGPYGRQVAEVVPKIEAAVGLKFKTPPRVETRSKEQVRQYIVKQVSDSQAVRELNGEEAAYKRLGLIPDTLLAQMHRRMAEPGSGTKAND